MILRPNESVPDVYFRYFAAVHEISDARKLTNNAKKIRLSIIIYRLDNRILDNKQTNERTESAFLVLTSRL